MSAAPDLPSMYRDARFRVLGLVDGLAPGDADRPVRATPGWTVHDVVAHVVGLTDDALHDNMEGAPGSDWTAAQVSKRADTSMDGLLLEWEANIDAFADAVGSQRLAPPVIDLACHEQDLRGALGVPGARDNEIIRFAVSVLGPRASGLAAAAGLRPLAIVINDDGERFGAGPDDAGTTLSVDRFELFRAMAGRRSVAQISALDWSADPAPYLEHLTIFAPSALDIVE
jgi:uncharacterized protein (TIGR03083 family)